MTVRTTYHKFVGVKKYWTGSVPPQLLTVDVSAGVNETQEKIGQNNPRWKSQIRAGADATTPFDASEYFISSFSPGTLRTRYYDGSYKVYREQSVDGNTWLARTSCWGKPLWTLNTSKADSDALAVFIRRATAVNQSFDSFTALGELAETLRMLHHPASALQRGIQSYSKSVRKRTSRLMRGLTPNSAKGSRTLKEVGKIVTDSWLEYQYGWRPLAKDIESAYHAASKATSIVDLVVVKGGGRQQSYSFGNDSVSTGIGATETGSYRTIQTATVIYRAGIKVTVGKYATPLGQWGVSTRNFLPSVWELTPYSFLVDYFTNIGNMISALSFPRTSVAWSNKTVITEAEKRFTANAVNPSSGYSILDWSPQIVVHRNRTVSRRTYGGSFIPSLDFHVPGSKQLLNIAALIGSNSLFHT